MHEKPMVSILIPCYNHEAFLDDCLTGILCQTYENIELLICDDCSPDSSYQIIQKFAPKLRERFSRVEILRNEINCGVTKNINRMLAMAKGEYIKILASDDSMVPEAVEAMVAYFAEHPQCAVVIANGVRVAEEQHYSDFTPVSEIYSEPPDFSPEGFFERTARCNRIFAPGAMLQRSVFQTYGYYDETIPVEDMEYWLRLLKSGEVRFGYQEKKLIYYRINGNSMSSVSGNAGLEKRRRRMHNAVVATLEKHRDGFSHGLFEEITVDYMLNEYSFALNTGLKIWAAELRVQLWHFAGWKAITWKRRMRLKLRRLKMLVKELLHT